MTDTTLPTNPVTVNDIVDPTLERDQFEYYTNLQLDQFEGEPFVWGSKRRKSAAKYMIKSRVGGNYIDKTLDALDKTHDAVSFVSFCAYWTEVRRECETYEEIQKEAVANLRATNRPRSALGREDLRTAKVVAYSADYHQGRGQAELTLRGKGIDQIYPITPAHQDWPIIAACGFDFIGETEVENFTYNGVVIPKQMRHTCDFTITYKYVRNGSENELRVESLVMNADQTSFPINPNAAEAQIAADMAGIKKGGAFAGGISNPATPEQIEAAKAAVAPIVAKLPEQAAALAAKDDEKPAPSVLDNAFPRENGQPVEEVPADHVMGNLDPEPEPPAKNAKHWMDNTSKRGKFFATITELFEKAGIYKGDIEKAAEHAIDVIQLHDAPSLSESIDLCEVYAGVVASVQANIEKFEKMYDVKNLLGIAYPQFPNVDRALRLGEFLRPIDLWESIKIKGLLEVEKRKPTAPQTPETAPQVNETSDKAIETPITQNTPDLTALLAVLPKLAQHHVEAEFIVNFDMRDPNGDIEKFTLRAENEFVGYQRKVAFQNFLKEQGYTHVSIRNGMTNNNTPATQPPPTTPTAPASALGSDGGKNMCAMIRLETGYESGKLQLQFECDGMEHALRFSKPVGEMVKLLSKVKKADGSPFTANDLQPGRKFGGMWYVSWSKSVKGDKTYRNVVDVTAS